MTTGTVPGSEEDLTGRLDQIMKRLDRIETRLAQQGRPASTAGA
jgi:hypothetical protein